MAAQVRTTQHPPEALKRSLTTKALAFFSLKQTWETRKKTDYVLVPLIDEPVTLGANNHWSLTANSVRVTAQIAATAAQRGIKVLAFFQSIPFAWSAAKRIHEILGQATIALDDEEDVWLRTAAFELGGTEYLQLPLDGREVKSYASVHHGLLLPEERWACESL